MDHKKDHKNNIEQGEDGRENHNEENDESIKREERKQQQQQQQNQIHKKRGIERWKKSKVIKQKKNNAEKEG